MAQLQPGIALNTAEDMVAVGAVRDQRFGGISDIVLRWSAGTSVLPDGVGDQRSMAP